MKHTLDSAVKSLRRGDFVILHDSNEREDECDFVIPAEFMTPKHLARMRVDGGGLICVAIGGEIADLIELPFFSDIRDYSGSKFRALKNLSDEDIKYDSKSAFSITINSRETRTGISDIERALTIKKFGELCKNLTSDHEKNIKKFSENFRTPGHVHLLISRGIENREGHTELSTELLRISELNPVAAICEIMDSETNKAMTKEKTIKYAEMHKIPFVESSDLQ